MVLTADQARFAREHQAHNPLPSEDGMVLLYRDAPGMTIRWLVDRMGTAVSRWSFQRDLPSI
jgi:hypothetical protein